MGTHRSIPVIVTPADLRAGSVTREVADAVRAGRVRYVGFTEGAVITLPAGVKPVRVAYDEAAWPREGTPWIAAAIRG
ncbi:MULTISPECIES: hypothetical protein [Methylobacterium]|uniref:Uncharacterized protein n=1 Tax=Methylobacterium aquaticum TaxID=270351 RepID=A0A0C6FGB0_9HYPH|nr:MULTISPECIES: hypothetical protein [Methylobacterium]NGM37130.1 hypothetical protein [Methylobacterium sp. DB0501]BAQ47593.1 hypothetical protein Maq22A_c23145 [Methylobacterium aquaticum]